MFSIVLSVITKYTCTARGTACGPPDRNNGMAAVMLEKSEE
jgi:hypothetical protein